MAPLLLNRLKCVLLKIHFRKEPNIIIKLSNKKTFVNSYTYTKLGFTLKTLKAYATSVCARIRAGLFCLFEWAHSAF